jgi:predicted permease
MNNIALLLVCLAIGVTLREFGRLPDNAPTTINGYIVNVALPALIFQQIHVVRFHANLALAILMPWILFGASVGLFWLIGERLNLPRKTTGALAVVGGLGNTSFLGLPMIESFFGEGGMQTGILIDQFGSYLVLSTAGIALVCAFAGGHVSRLDMMRRIATFPPLIALVGALALTPFTYPPLVSSVLARLAATLAPLALISVGLQLRLGEIAGRTSLLALGLGYKLVAGPLIILALYAGLIGLRGETTELTVFEAAMPPMIGGAIVAMQYGLDAKLITLMVGIGTVAGFLTLPFWAHAVAMF